MEQVTVPKLLDSYSAHVEANDVLFIANSARPRERQKVLTLIQTIRELFNEAGEDENNLDWSKCHEACTDLWCLLTRIALRDIDDESKGNSRLTDFLRVSINFEEVLYGISDYYRDHTLHVVWVYLLGDYLLRGPLRPIYDSLDWYLFNDIEVEQDWQHLQDKASVIEKRIRAQLEPMKDAIWCLTALCHDLGYSLSKLEDINKRVEPVLDFFDFHGFDQVGYSLNVEHQHLTRQLIELMTVDVRIEADTDESDVRIKLYADDGSFWRLCNSLERREHGTLSAFILYKLVGLFGDATLRGPAEEWGLEEEEAVDTIARGTVLYAIAQHEFKYVWASELGSLADILLLCDEVEEFSRWPGRPLVARKYTPTMAKAGVDFEHTGEGKNAEVAIAIKYEVHKEHSVRKFFARKASRLAQVYHLRSAETGQRARIGRPRISKFTKISNIEIVACQNEEELRVCFQKDGINAELPAHGDLPNGSYELQLIDDQLYVILGDHEIDLDKWLAS